MDWLRGTRLSAHDSGSLVQTSEKNESEGSL
jgi:hypothetical protein